MKLDFYLPNIPLSHRPVKDRAIKLNSFLQETSIVFSSLLKTGSSSVHPACCIFRVSFLFNPHLNNSPLPWGHFLWKGQEREETEAIVFSSLFHYFCRLDPLAYILCVASSEFLSFLILI